jgi:hypothetical protein
MGVYKLSRLLMTVILMVAVTLMTGCLNKEVSGTSQDWKETGTLELTTKNDKGEEIKARWIGQEGRLAMSNNPFVAGEKQKYMWLLWGNKNELVGKAFKVTATSQTGEEITVVESVLGGTNLGATAASPSSNVLQKKGLWKLNAYVVDKLHGTLIIKVQ